MKYLFLLLLILTGCQNEDPLNIKRKTINVTIVGAVEKQLSLDLDIDTRLADVEEMLILAQGADSSFFEQDLLLKNNDVIVVPYINQVKISINNATDDELQKLPSIGKVIANRIINYRNENGLFQSLEEIMLVRGIKEKTFNKIKDLICL